MRISIKTMGNYGSVINSSMHLVDSITDASGHLWFSCCVSDQKYETSICSDGRKEVRFFTKVRAFTFQKAKKHLQWFLLLCQVVKMLLIVIVMLFIFWTPCMCYMAVMAFYKEVLPFNHDKVNTRTQSWGYMNSCINFFVYAATSKYAFVMSSLNVVIITAHNEVGAR